MNSAKQNIALVASFQIVLTVLFVIFTDYDKIYHGKSYASKNTFLSFAFQTFANSNYGSFKI